MNRPAVPASRSDTGQTDDTDLSLRFRRAAAARALAELPKSINGLTEEIVQLRAELRSFAQLLTKLMVLSRPTSTDDE